MHYWKGHIAHCELFRFADPNLVAQDLAGPAAACQVRLKDPPEGNEREGEIGVHEPHWPESWTLLTLQDSSGHSEGGLPFH